MNNFQIRLFKETDRCWIAKILKQSWGSPLMVTRGRIIRADLLPGYIALTGNKRVGLATFNILDSECEIVTLNSLSEASGIGTALIEAVRSAAISFRCRRLWLVTTNDNLHALRFYQKRGFILKAVHCNALEQSRRLKPEIPTLGIDGIPLRDEIELEMLL